MNNHKHPFRLVMYWNSQTGLEPYLGELKGRTDGVEYIRGDQFARCVSALQSLVQMQVATRDALPDFLNLVEALQERMKWIVAVDAWLKDLPQAYVVRVCEGGGPEDLQASFAVTAAKVRAALPLAPPTPMKAPPGLEHEQHGEWLENAWSEISAVARSVDPSHHVTLTPAGCAALLMEKNAFLARLQGMLARLEGVKDHVGKLSPPVYEVGTEFTPTVQVTTPEGTTTLHVGQAKVEGIPAGSEITMIGGGGGGSHRLARLSPDQPRCTRGTSCALVDGHEGECEIDWDEIPF